MPRSANGLRCTVRSRDLARQYGLQATSGIVVTGVEDGSPADDTGIQEGDVITEVNGDKITDAGKRDLLLDYAFPSYVLRDS